MRTTEPSIGEFLPPRADASRRFRVVALAVAVVALLVTTEAFAPGTVAVLAISALAAGALFALLVLRRYEFFVLTILAVRASLDVFKSGDRVSQAVDPASLVGVLLIAAGVLWLSLDRERWRRTRSPIRWPLAALTASGALSLVAAAHPFVGGGELLRFVAVLVMVVSLEGLIVDDAALGRLLAAVLVSCVVPVLVGLLQVVTGTGEVELGGFARITGTFVHPNPFAFYLVLLMLFGVALLPSLRQNAWLATVMALVGCGVCLLFTYTRTAWIGLFLGLLVIAALQRRRVLAGLCVAAVIGGLLLPGVSARFSDLGTSEQRSGKAGNSLVWRTAYWRDTLDLVENPGTGIGLKMVTITEEEEKAPHNDFVRAFVELGVLGFAAYCWLIVAVIGIARRALRATRAAPGAGFHRGVAVGFAACTTAFVVFSIVSNIISQVVVVWYFFAFAIAAHVVAKRADAAPRSI